MVSTLLYFFWYIQLLDPALPGIDYFGLQILISMRDIDRIKALSHPFAYTSKDSGNTSKTPYQYHSETVLFSSSRGGQCITSDAHELLLSSHSELAPYIKTGRAFFKEGDKVWLKGKNIRTTHPTAKLAPK